VYDAEIPEMKPAWTTKPLEVNVRNVSYDLVIEPHFSTSEHVVDKHKDMTIDGHVIVSNFL
jgi:hypothetical protein